ncbi:hypothetical protein [Dokdonia sp. PRO95]|uniref:hypothetical protein n=1 Tax=unclassified Dokdonia TaxID=2615033 RepID=UPI00135F1954|nr:hypothetical protein [Dokdonia sp. PRO95]
MKNNFIFGLRMITRFNPTAAQRFENRVFWPSCTINIALKRLEEFAFSPFTVFIFRI